MKALVAATLLFTSLAFGQTERWIPTWVASPQAPRSLGPARAGAFNGSFNDQTVRMVVHTSIPGHRVRVELSNAYGAKPLVVGSVHIALRVKDSAIAPDSDRTLMFNGKPSCSIPVGAFMISDPVNLDVPSQGDLAVSVYVPEDTGVATTHSVGLHTTWISKTGDVTGKPEITDATTTQSWYWISGVEVMAPARTASVVTFGDSITDGTRSTPNTDGSWPAFLAARLLGNPATSEVAVLNQGISANRMLQDGFGVSALARFDRDVVSQPGVKWMTILEGINDIGAGIGPDFVFTPNAKLPAKDIVTADQLIGAYKQIIERAHEHGIKVYGSPLMPFEGAAYYRESGNVIRQAVNEWIRTSGAFDALIDFDAITRDPANPNKMRAEFDSGDHLHPNNKGYKAMADAIDLSLFSDAGSKAGGKPAIKGKKKR
ncbi:MAG TPA: SGNH/GDSL hydrolase family protein [Bryobacteraceae bacterium]|jgi:lysophospholipase L1-like esterase|nr:SGNH/GDSL hydrolase family protein [Bryobacteraceae bacterium]